MGLDLLLNWVNDQSMYNSASFLIRVRGLLTTEDYSKLRRIGHQYNFSISPSKQGEEIIYFASNEILGRCIRRNVREFTKELKKFEYVAGTAYVPPLPSFLSSTIENLLFRHPWLI